MQTKNAKDLKLDYQQNGYLGFSFLVLTPEIKISIFQNQIFFYKVKIVEDIKTEFIVYSYIPTTSVHNFEPISLFFAMQWHNNQVKVMTSPFWNAIFGISNNRTLKQMTFWNPATKLDKIGMFFKENFEFRNLTFLPEHDLALGQIWKWVSPSNSTSQMTHIACVTR